jgi:hypothetical protein
MIRNNQCITSILKTHLTSSWRNWLPTKRRISKMGAFVIAVDAVAQFNNHATEIQITAGSEPNVSGVDTSICPVNSRIFQRY